MQDISPALFMAGMWGYQTTAALKAAIELDLFTAIGEGANAPESLAARTGAAVRGARILADFLTIRGFLEKHDGAYSLTPSTAAFLDRRSPTYFGSTIDFIASPEMLELVLADPAKTVRTGGSPGLANVASDNPVWVKFARAMVPWAAPLAHGIAAQVSSWSTAPRKVLDIAAGHGLYGIALAQALPSAEITAVDWSNVLEVAREHATAAGVMDRFHMLIGSAFEVDWGGGFDLILLPNFLHHFDTDACVGLLRKVRTSLASGGRVLASEFVPNSDRISPPDSAAFSYVMLGTTPHGDAYTLAEFDAMARAAGFSGVTGAPLGPSPQTLVEFLR
jgi:hypothetical protein